jgi:hypothetical protein
MVRVQEEGRYHERMLSLQRPSGMRPMRVNVVALAVPIALGVVACMASISLGTIRKKAAQDLSCDEGKVEVMRVDVDGGAKATDSKTYRARGCNRKATYACQGWDTYSQEPICERQD